MKSRQYDKIICLDFDGVINLYKGWRNEGFNVILDNCVVKGTKEAIEKLRKDHLVIIHSTRCSHRGGKRAIKKWLKRHKIKVDKVCVNKPLADIYIDDRAIGFDGDWKKMLRKVKRFRQWCTGSIGVEHVIR
jgi:hypothetical protein